MPHRLRHIGIRSFAGCKNLQEIGFSNGITEIHETAFQGCTSLKKVMFPKEKKDLAREFEENFESCTIELA